MSFGEKPRRSRLPLVVVVLLVVAVAGGFAIWSAGVVGDPPVIDIVAPSAVGQRADVVVTVREPRRGLVDVVIEGSGAGLGATMLGEEHHEAPGRPWQAPESTETKLTVVVGKVVQPALTEGTLTIKVTATTAGSWWSKPSPVVVERALTVKLTPPTVTPMSSFVHVAQGGAEAIVYEVGPTSTRDGVVVDRADGTSPPWVFVGSPLPGGPPSRHFVLFALPYDDAGPEADVRGRVKLFAEDDVGNRTTSPFIHKYIPRPMPKDTIVLKDAFLAKVTGEIFAQTPQFTRSGDLLADYLVLNRELRKKNNAYLVELAQRSVQKFLWSKTFQPFDNASIKGAFADRRTYRYNDADVDTQDHLGFDLARVERTPVNAGNDGVVVHAAYLGIFGNCVIVDHGYGLMTLYAHLSAISVAVGDAVIRGQTVGNTGATGLAGGDHLHFTTLLHGQAVNPIEWWDGHWIADRLKLKLGDAMPWAPDAAAEPGPVRKRR
jgi:murein DD-endopeptidase MepM/ murein hydrolase activator NlpD